MKQKAFFITFKGLPMKQITQLFLEGESPTLNFYTVLLLKIYDQRRQLNIFIKDAMILRNIAFERVKRVKRRHVKVIQLFWH